jgi:drug/metabolite transporter (DMT)-like permease
MQKGSSESNRAGIIYMLVAMFLFTSNDAIGKWMVATYPVGQLIGLRSLAALVVLAIILWRKQGSLWLSMRERPIIQVLRIGFVVAEVGCFFAAVRYLPLADVFMFYLASPLFLTIFSVAILKEYVGLHQWLAVLVGLVGVVLVFPFSEDTLSAPALIALAGSISLAMMLTLTRMLRNTDSMTLIMIQTIGVAIFGGVTIPFAWVTPNFIDLSLICLLGLIATFAHFLMNKSVSAAAPAVVAPFQYTSIVWAITIGYLVWQDLPTQPALLGATFIIGAGLIVLYHERDTSNRRS